jgi:hypothetical protein
MTAINRVHQALPIFLVFLKKGINEKRVYKKTDIPARYNGISMGKCNRVQSARGHHNANERS